MALHLQTWQNEGWGNQFELWREQVGRLHENQPGLMVLRLPIAEYTYEPSGQFLGSALEIAVEANTVLTSLLIDGSGRHLDMVRQTVEGLSGCTLPFSLAARCGSSRSGTNFTRTAQLSRALQRHSTLTSLDLQHAGIQREGLELLLSTGLANATNLTSLNIACNPTGVLDEMNEELEALEATALVAMCNETGLQTNGTKGELIQRINIDRSLRLSFFRSDGQAICKFLDLHTRLTSLVLGEDQNLAVDRYHQFVAAQMVSFAMGMHPRLGNASPIRMLGLVRGDKDSQVRYDVPLFKTITKYIVNPERAHPVIETRAYPPEHINLKVKGRDGSIVYFKVKMSTPLGRLMEAYCNRQNLSMEETRFLFHGYNLRKTQTPGELQMEDDDWIDTFASQVGQIGRFAQHSRSYGLELLKSKMTLQQASAVEGKRIVDILCPAGPPDMRGLIIGDSMLVLNVSACAAVVGFFDVTKAQQHIRIDASHGKHDEQLDISLMELEQLVGRQQGQDIVRLYDSAIDRITIRRVQATEESLVIAFHTDHASYKTMQVALNLECDYDGGRLVYATLEGFLQPTRPPGSYTIHHCHMPHGVTALSRGVRYSIFFQTILQPVPAGPAE